MERAEDESAGGAIEVPQTPRLCLRQLQPRHLPVLASDALKKGRDGSRLTGRRRPLNVALGNHVSHRGKPRSRRAAWLRGRKQGLAASRYFILNAAPHSERASTMGSPQLFDRSLRDARSVVGVPFALVC